MAITEERLEELQKMTREEFKETEEYRSFKYAASKAAEIIKDIVRRIVKIFKEIAKDVAELISLETKREEARHKFNRKWKVPLDTTNPSQISGHNIKLPNIRRGI